MLMTQDDAVQKQCPLFAMVGAFTMSPGIKIGSGDPHVSDPKKGKCVADRCMMWREGEPEVEWRGLDTFLDQKPEKWTPILVERAALDAIKNGFTLGKGAAIHGQQVIVGKFVAKRGYCGIAGEPK